METITIGTFVGFCNRGAEALLLTRIESIRKLVPDVKFYVLSIYTETCVSLKDVEYIDTFGGRAEKLRSIKYLFLSVYKAIVWTGNAFIFRLTGHCRNNDIKKIASSDVFVSTDGDTLGENYGFFPLLWRTYYLALGIIMKIPIVIYAEGTGPFNSRLGRIIAKYLFDKCAYISVRDEISRNHLVKLGIEKRKVNLVMDSAFLLNSSKKYLSFRENDKRLVGVAVSKLAAKYGFQGKKGKVGYKSFVDFMAKLIDWMIVNLNAKVIMIPHVVQITRDDYQTARDIFKKIKNKNNVEILNRDFKASEFKKAISCCDLVIASRMHAAIAALSTNVPVIGIAYSHKMLGIFKGMGISDLVVDIKDLDLGIRNKIEKVLLESGSIKTKLKTKMARAKKLAWKPAYEVARILNSRKTQKSIFKNLRYNKKRD
ncbi:MAG: colanic acid biosynthesis protein [Microgenomates group bacterium ADurb.Bin219]|nr:MAG: colanic acid biosynthesis protein [Microgenomates group bacterium ADurb.Bin219]